jgi:hypothetical protein
MKGGGDGKIEIGIVPLSDGWVMFRVGITPTTEMCMFRLRSTKAPFDPTLCDLAKINDRLAGSAET